MPQFLNLTFTVLSRTFTCEELLAPGAPFIKKVLTVGSWELTSDLTYEIGEDVQSDF